MGRASKTIESWGFRDAGTRGPRHRDRRHHYALLLPKRFHGTVTLDAARVGLDASRVADEVIAHLTGLVFTARR